MLDNGQVEAVLACSEYLAGLAGGTTTDAQRNEARKYIESADMADYIPKLACAIITAAGEQVRRGGISAQDALAAAANEFDALGIAYFDLQAEKENIAALLALYSEENCQLPSARKYELLSAMERSSETSKFRAAYSFLMLQIYLNQNSASGANGITTETVKRLAAYLRGVDTSDSGFSLTVNVIRSALFAPGP